MTLSTQAIHEAFKGSEIKTAFLHGHSYTANPIACAAAIASWELLQDEKCQSRIDNISTQTERLIMKLKNHPNVKTARSLGTIGAMEWKNDLNYFS